MTKFHVYWGINVEAEDAKGAAQEALDIIRDPGSGAYVFLVFDEGGMGYEQVDLGELEQH